MVREPIDDRLGSGANDHPGVQSLAPNPLAKAAAFR